MNKTINTRALEINYEQQKTAKNCRLFELVKYGRHKATSVLLHIAKGQRIKAGVYLWDR